MAWWAPWTWFYGSRKEDVEGEMVKFPSLEPPEERNFSWLRPWTWLRRGKTTPEELGVGYPGLGGIPREGFERYAPAIGESELGEELPELEVKKPSEKALFEEEEFGEFPLEEEEYPGGVYISDSKVRGGFKKFCLALFSIFLLPFILVFGLFLAACAFLLIFPVLIAIFPVFLGGIFVLCIVAPVALPVLIIYLLFTERGMLLINSKGRLFSIISVPQQGKNIPVKEVAGETSLT